jgi:hypothetical protein
MRLRPAAALKGNHSLTTQVDLSISNHQLITTLHTYYNIFINYCSFDCKAGIVCYTIN